MNKYISDAGVCSRREADRLIAAGQVQIDGETAVCGQKVAPGQQVTVAGKVIGGRRDMVVLAVHKPAGIICTEDPGVKENIIRFLDYPVRVTYAGRLDKESEGLLLMTNNGELIHQMMRARNGHEKEYLVTVDRPVTDAFVRGMAAGVRIVDEEKGLDQGTRPCIVEKTGSREFKIILTQGLNRQIRRMCKVFGYRVTRLVRVRILNIRLDGLKSGKYRKLTDEELEELYRELHGEHADSRGTGRVPGAAWDNPQSGL